MHAFSSRTHLVRKNCAPLRTNGPWPIAPRTRAHSSKPFAPLPAKGPCSASPSAWWSARPRLPPVPSVKTTDAPVAAPPTSPATGKEKFVWTKQWYPVFPKEFLDPAKPIPFTLLGKDLVLWQDSQGEWRCFEDRCPHRLVQLSEGWVNGDTLECAYHGWRFQGDGTCTSIPSIADPAALATATASKRSCVKSYPVQTCATGLVWVWAESGPVAWVESAATPPRIMPDLETEQYTPMRGRWYMRDLPYDWELFIENVVDPAHVDFAHHGFPGFNRAEACTLEVATVEDISAQGGFKVGVEMPTRPSSTNEYRPPCLALITSNLAKGGQQYLVLYATPIRKGWVRHIGVTFLKGTKEARMLSLFAGAKIPAWLNHYLASDFLHGDQVLLYSSTRTLEAEGRQWQKSYFIPTSGDKGVSNFWTWLTKHAGGTVPYPKGQDTLPPPISREELLDRFNQHTKHCPHCRKALATTNSIQAAARTAAFLLLGLAVTAAWAAARTAAAAVPVGQVLAAAAAINPVPALVLAGFLAIVVQLLERFKQGFYFVDYQRPA